MNYRYIISCCISWIIIGKFYTSGKLIQSKNIFDPKSRMFPSKLKSKLNNRIKTRLDSSTPFGKRIQGKFQSASVDNLSSVLVKTKDFISHTDNPHDRRKLQMNDESNYKPFRVTFLTDMVENAMKDNVFTNDNGYKPKMEFLMNHVLPEVKSFFSQLLKTIPYPLPKI